MKMKNIEWCDLNYPQDVVTMLEGLSETWCGEKAVYLQFYQGILFGCSTPMDEDDIQQFIRESKDGIKDYVNSSDKKGT